MAPGLISVNGVSVLVGRPRKKMERYVYECKDVMQSLTLEKGDGTLVDKILTSPSFFR